MTHSVTFTITNEAFSAALGNPASLEYQLLSENIRHQVRASSSVCSGVLTPAHPLPHLPLSTQARPTSVPWHGLFVHPGPPRALRCPCCLAKAASLERPPLVTQSPCPAESASLPL